MLFNASVLCTHCLCTSARSHSLCALPVQLAQMRAESSRSDGAVKQAKVLVERLQVLMKEATAKARYAPLLEPYLRMMQQSVIDLVPFRYSHAIHDCMI